MPNCLGLLIQASNRGLFYKHTLEFDVYIVLQSEWLCEYDIFIFYLFSSFLILHVVTLNKTVILHLMFLKLYYVITII